MILTAKEEALLNALYWMVVQHCTKPDGTLFSDFLSANADAMRILGHEGRITITNDGYWRCVEARLLEVGEL